MIGTIIVCNRYQTLRKGGDTMKKVVAILVSILFVLSMTGLCFAQAAPAAPADKAKVADKNADDKKADKKKADKKKAPKKAKAKKAPKKADEKPAAPAPADKK